MEGDVSTSFKSLSILFQSTPSAWRVTESKRVSYNLSKISIHTLRMEGDDIARAFSQPGKDISIHTLRMEGDLERISSEDPDDSISIHTLRMEGDGDFVTTRRRWRYFNPHPPHGG